MTKTDKILVGIFSLILIVVGMWLIAEYSSLWVAGGVFLVLWGNNLTLKIRK